MVRSNWGRYAKNGKIVTPITDEEFAEGIENGHFVQQNHKAYCVLLFYTAMHAFVRSGISPQSKIGRG